ncbi:MAG: hypothetical protein R3261_04605 [Alphaproteobacteria bacterium]|nr:hypothetical protein [Alphaproteobacteria bacterium]
MNLAKRFILFYLVLLVSACSTDGELDNIVWQKLTWASFLNGDDIRRSCKEGGFVQSRYIVNANRAKDVYIFDWLEDSQVRQRHLQGSIDVSEAVDLLQIVEIFQTKTTILEANADLSENLTNNMAKFLREMSEVASDDLIQRVSSASYFSVYQYCDGSNFKRVFVPWLDMVRRDEILSKLEEVTGLDYFPHRSSEEVEISQDIHLATERDGFTHYLIHVYADEINLGMHGRADRQPELD